MRKNTCFYNIIHFYMQFSAIVSRFIVKTYLRSTFTNVLKRKLKFSKKNHSCRLSLFKGTLICQICFIIIIIIFVCVCVWGGEGWGGWGGKQ